MEAIDQVGPPVHPVTLIVALFNDHMAPSFVAAHFGWTTAELAGEMFEAGRWFAYNAISSRGGYRISRLSEFIHFCHRAWVFPDAPLAGETALANLMVSSMMGGMVRAFDEMSDPGEHGEPGIVIIDFGARPDE